jgi:predicted DNA-binding transcriptional regulator AlpA
MRVYRFRELKGAGVPFCRKHIAHLENLGDFPMHFNIGKNTIAWVAGEVDQWVEERVRRRRPLSGEAKAVPTPHLRSRNGALITVGDHRSGGARATERRRS